MNVELTPDEVRLIVQALKDEAAHWAAEWARASDLPTDSQKVLWEQVNKHYVLAAKLELS